MIEQYMQAGIEAANCGDFSTALDLFSKAAAVRPDPDVYYNMAVLEQLRSHNNDAKKLFRRAIGLRPDFADAYINLGAIIKAEGNYKEAEKCLRRAIKVRPAAPEAYNDLGLLLAQQGNYRAAEAAYRQALKAQPGYPRAYNNLGLLYAETGDYEAAAEAFQQAVAVNRNFPEAYNNLGSILRRQGRLKDSEMYLRKALALRKSYPDALYNLSLTMEKTGRVVQAIDFCRKALQLRPAYPEAQNQLGVLLLGRGRLDEAEQCFRQAIAAQADFVAAYNNLGDLLRKQGADEEAAACLNRAVQLSPGNASAQNSLGLALRELNDYRGAEDCFRKALVLEPDFYGAYVNLGMLLTDEARLTEAEDCIHRAKELDGNKPDARYAEATLYLLQERFREGWAGYEARFPLFHNYQPDIRRWHGEPLTGRSILLFYEQGIGDTLQFMRYVPQVAAQAAKTVVWVQPALARLLDYSSRGRFTVISGKTAPTGWFDFACPLLSLPQVFGTVAENIPLPDSVESNPVISRHWRERLLQAGGGAGLVGITWAGNPRHHNDKRRSMPLPVAAQLFDNKAVTWVNLNVDADEAERSQLEGKAVDLIAGLSDFAETAGLIDCLDLVITVDTAIAHLAASLGKPTWLMVPFTPEWRWQLARDDSPWYPSMRIFRQQVRGDWYGVIAAVAAALQNDERWS